MIHLMLGFALAALRSAQRYLYCSLLRLQGCYDEKWTMWSWPQSKENHKFVWPSLALGRAYRFMYEVQLQQRSWLPTPGMKAVQAAKGQVSSPNRSQMGSNYPTFYLFIPAQDMSPVRKTKSQGLLKWSFDICYETKCPKGAKVPISPNTAMFICSNCWTLRGGALKYLVFEKVKLSASPTLQQQVLSGSKPFMTALYILPWNPPCPTLQVVQVPSALKCRAVGSLPNSTMGRLQSSGVETHITCISPSLLVSPRWICLCPFLVVILILATQINSLSVTLALESESKKLWIGRMSCYCIWCYGSMN